MKIQRTLNLIEEEKYQELKDNYFNGNDDYFSLEINNVFLCINS